MVSYRTFSFGEIATERLAGDYSNLKNDCLVQSFLAQTEGESDRGMALISAAFLDSLLEEKLKRMFVKGNSSSREKLFSAMGPFGSTSSKIEALYCAGKISKDIYHDLHIVRKLRNTCAHEWEQFNFTDVMNVRLVKNLKSTFLLESMMRNDDSLPIHPRTKYIVVVAALIFILNIDETGT